MLIPKNQFMDEIIVKKSRFIGFGFPISTVDEARENISLLKKNYIDSRHICYGFSWGKDSSHMGMSDDGEPHGTAGMPILEVIKGSGYNNILIAVVRYFGGIKLGTGGLVKAYTEISQSIVKGIEVEEFIERFQASITVPYTLYNQIKLLIDSFNCIVIEEVFETDIIITFLLSCELENNFVNNLNDISSGKLKIRKF